MPAPISNVVAVVASCFSSVLCFFPCIDCRRMFAAVLMIGSSASVASSAACSKVGTVDPSIQLPTAVCDTPIRFANPLILVSPLLENASSVSSFAVIFISL